MTVKLDRTIAAARRAADHLVQQGAHMDAEAVRAVCRSLAASNQTSSRHFKAALVLRAQLIEAGLEPKA